MLVNGLLELATTQIQVTHVFSHVSYCVARAYTHSLDAFFIHTDAPEQGLEHFAEREGEEADRAELQAVGHFLQDGRRFSLDLVGRHAGLFRNLDKF